MRSAGLFLKNHATLLCSQHESAKVVEKGEMFGSPYGSGKSYPPLPPTPTQYYIADKTQLEMPIFSPHQKTLFGAWKQSAGNTLVDRNVAGNQAKKT